MSNEFRGCWTCARTAMLCPHRVATIPCDGTVCPSGYGDRSLKTQAVVEHEPIPRIPQSTPIREVKEKKKRPRKIKTEHKGLTPEKRREMSERAKAKWNALTSEDQQAHKDKIAAGKKKSTEFSVERHIGLVLTIWYRFGYHADSFEDMLQDACEVVLTAKKEHDPSRGKLTTCIGKVSRRFLMRKRRENKKRNLQFHAGTIREFERTNQTGVQAVFPQESIDYVQENGGSLWK